LGQCYNFFTCLTRETLLKGKAQYNCPPCTNLLRSSPFYIENIIYIFNKTSYLNEEVNRIEPSPSVSIPWFNSSHSGLYYKNIMIINDTSIGIRMMLQDVASPMIVILKTL
jgi:hypothetical protein